MFYKILFFQLIFLQIDKTLQIGAKLSREFTTEEKLIHDKKPYEPMFLTTQDGYIIKVDHIPVQDTSMDDDDPNPTLTPILFAHGFYSSSTCWLLEPRKLNKTLVYHLHRKGHPIFLYNARGNVYSRNHTRLNPNEGSKFGSAIEGYWNFSFEEMARFDLPILIDTILKKTNHSKLIYIGHSLGATIFLTMLSEFPLFNEKIYLSFALSPLVFLANSKNKAKIIPQALTPGFSQGLKSFIEASAPGEFLPKGSSASLVDSCLASKALMEIICAASIFNIAGYNPKQMDSSMSPDYYSHWPEGSSLRTQFHIWQTTRVKKFTKYNWGSSKNLQIYGTESPPEYKLENVKAPLVIFYGKGDLIVDVADIYELYMVLDKNYKGENAKNLIPILIDDPNWAHADYFWAKDLNTMFNEHVINIIETWGSRAEKNSTPFTQDIFGIDL